MWKNDDCYRILFTNNTFWMMKKNVKRKYMGCVLCVWLQAMTKIMYWDLVLRFC